MNKKEKAKAIIDILKQRYDDAACALHYAKDYELMIAVRLSAQCTDARVNLVTPALFAAYPTLEAMAEESSDFCHRIVLFGRDCCTARNPMCGECPLTMYCKEFNPQA